MTGKIPRPFIDDLLQRVDIVDLIDGRVPLKKAGKEYKACCPFHDEKTPSFTVSSDKQFYHCFGCGAHGTAISFLMEYDRMNFPEAVQSLANQAGISLPDDRDHAPQADLGELFDLLDQADRYYQQQLREHAQSAQAIEYLKQRGVSGKIAGEFSVGFAPNAWDGCLNAMRSAGFSVEKLISAGLVIKNDHGKTYDRFRDRIMFPIHDHRGRVIGFGGRILDDGEPKYLNSPETPVFHKGSSLYGLYAGRDAIRREQKVLVVEGYMDVIALVQHDIRHVVATLGTSTTAQHLERLFRHAPEIVFCFDGDKAGRKAAWRALEMTMSSLRDGRQISFLFLPDGHDPDSYLRDQGAEAFLALSTKASSLPDYLLDQLTSEVDLGRLDGRARLFELAKPLITRLPDGTLRELILNKLARTVDLDRQTLDKGLDQATVPAARRSVNRPARADNRGQIKHTPIRVMMALLLQQPRLVRISGDLKQLKDLKVAGLAQLRELMELISNNPGINTAGLVERYRDTDYHAAIEKLAAWDLLIPDNGAENEFRTCIAHLYNEQRSQKIDSLLKKSRDQALDPSETEQLKELLQQKQE